jgi:hypothetical protein
MTSFRVERAQRQVVFAPFFEAQIFADELDDIGGLTDLFDCLLRYHISFSVSRL